jgi:hypothetical protein
LSFRIEAFRTKPTAAPAAVAALLAGTAGELLGGEFVVIAVPTLVSTGLTGLTAREDSSGMGE